MGKVIM